MAGWFQYLISVCHADLTGHRDQGRYLGSGVSWQPRHGIGARVASKVLVRFRHARVTVSPGDEEEDCAGH